MRFENMCVWFMKGSCILSVHMGMYWSRISCWHLQFYLIYKIYIPFYRVPFAFLFPFFFLSLARSLLDCVICVVLTGTRSTHVFFSSLVFYFILDSIDVTGNSLRDVSIIIGRWIPTTLNRKTIQSLTQI